MSLKKHPLKGEPVFDLLSIKHNELEIKKIYVVTPTCPVCREFLPKFVSDISSLIFVNSNDIEAYKNLIKKYPGCSRFYQIGTEDIKKLAIHFFPAVIFLNDQLKVKEVSWKYK